jgi:outer membrane protein
MFAMNMFKEFNRSMKSMCLRVLLAAAATLTISAAAQTGSTTAASNLPSAPSSPATSTGAPVPTTTKVGTINIQDAILGTNEGQRDMQELQKKFEPKQSQLKNQNDELEALKKQIDTQGPKLNDEALANLKKQIETKQKVFDRAVQDAQEEVGSQQQEIASKILTKMAPMIVKYSQENGYTMIVDTSKVWPQSPVLWWNAEAVDITKAVVDAYNVQSGVAPPAPAGGAAKPAGTKPAGTAKPAASAPPK